ncbi:hypothetical protein FB107DRAFT_224889, partial [Schizophyllum commune]
QQRSTSASPPASQAGPAFLYNFDNKLEQPDEFKPFSLIFNPVERVVICQKCDCLVPNLTKHFATDKHKKDGAWANADKKQLKALRQKIAQLGVSPKDPIIEPSMEPRPLIAGLSVVWAFTCTHCTFVRTERRHAANHCKEKKCHPNAAVVAERQQFQRPYRRHYVRVALPPSDTNPILASFLRFERAQASVPLEVPADARLVSPFLLRTLWYTHTELVDTTILLAATAFPTEEEFPGLIALVHLYFSECVRLIDSTDHLVRQHINTSEPAKYVGHVRNLYRPS